MFYVLNAFSPNMILSSAKVLFRKIGEKEAREIFAEHIDKAWYSAIGHESTSQIATQILAFPIPTSRSQVMLVHGDKGLIITLSFRPEEGRVYNYQELLQFLQEGKIAIYYFEVEKGE